MIPLSAHIAHTNMCCVYSQQAVLRLWPHNVLFEVMRSLPPPPPPTHSAFVVVAVDACNTASGWTVLHESASRGHIQTVDTLLSRHANILATSADGSSAVLLAAVYGHYDCVETLIAHGADIHARNNYGRNVLDVCAQSRLLAVREWACEYAHELSDMLVREVKHKCMIKPVAELVADFVAGLFCD